jgi:hypothetical protein
MIEATPGGATANSYVTLAEAEAYFAGRLHTGPWMSASQTDRERALLMAARALERLSWHGQRASSVQTLSWPRIGAPGAKDGAVPPVVREAQCEEALAWLTPALVRRRVLRLAGVTAAQTGPAREGYHPAGDEPLLSAEARLLLVGWVRLAGRLVADRAGQEG